MKRKRRTFSRDYKLAAVKKVVEQGLSYAEVARDLGIRDTLIHNWRKAFETDGTLEAEVNQSPSVEAELKRLRVCAFKDLCSRRIVGWAMSRRSLPREIRIARTCRACCQ